MLVSAPFMALRNEKSRNRPSTTTGGAPDHRPTIKKMTVMIHCCGTVNTRRPALSINATVTATPATATIVIPTPPASPLERPYFSNTSAANVAIAKYGSTLQNQNHDTNTVIRQYC